MNLTIKEEVLLDESMNLTEKAVLSLIDYIGLEVIDSEYICNCIGISQRNLIRVLYSLRDKGYIEGNYLAARQINIDKVNIGA